MPWDHALVRRQRGLDFRLLRGGAVTADDRRSGDAGFAQSITDRRRVGRAADRAARRRLLQAAPRLGPLSAAGAVPRTPAVSGTPGITGLPVAHQAITEALHVELANVAFTVGSFGFLSTDQRATVLLQ